MKFTRLLFPYVYGTPMILSAVDDNTEMKAWSSKGSARISVPMKGSLQGKEVSVKSTAVRNEM